MPEEEITWEMVEMAMLESGIDDDDDDVTPVTPKKTMREEEDPCNAVREALENGIDDDVDVRDVRDVTNDDVTPVTPKKNHACRRSSYNN
jgi:hypothetical protein